MNYLCFLGKSLLEMDCSVFNVIGVPEIAQATIIIVEKAVVL